MRVYDKDNHNHYVVVSDGNSKLGSIPSISFSPAFSCQREDGTYPPCLKDCYDNKKCYRTIFKNTYKSWVNNDVLFSMHRDIFWELLTKYFTKMVKNNKHYFRYFVAGDIPDKWFLKEMIVVAKEFPSINFLCFTKKSSYLTSPILPSIPSNLMIRRSSWPGMKPRLSPITEQYLSNKYNQAHITMKDGRTSIPKGKQSFHCLGSCQDCKFCWHAKEDVDFSQH